MFHKNQKGFTLVAAVFLVVFLAILGVVIAVYTITAAEETGNEFLSTQAFYYGESALYCALTDITDDNSLDVNSYTYTSPQGLASITATKSGTVWILECTATAGDPTSDKFARRTIRVLFDH